MLLSRNVVALKGVKIKTGHGSGDYVPPTFRPICCVLLVDNLALLNDISPFLVLLAQLVHYLQLQRDNW